MPKELKNHDENMNPALKAEVQGLRGAMIGSARDGEVPGYIYTYMKSSPYIRVISKKTGKSSDVALCDIHGFNQALKEIGI